MEKADTSCYSAVQSETEVWIGSALMVMVEVRIEGAVVEELK